MCSVLQNTGKDKGRNAEEFCPMKRLGFFSGAGRTFLDAMAGNLFKLIAF